ncbi:MAG: hypothetical protein R6U98_28250 [Pirellulaceae bacterium]
MKQLLYTSCEAGKSLDGDEGFQVRGASAGIGPERMRAALPYMAYGLPTHVSPSCLAPASTPVRLAFLKSPELGPILCHSVSAGLDPTTHRPGNFFSHLVLDVPPTFTAGAAIQTWGSDCWRRADGPFEVTLPDIEEIRATEALTDDGLRRFLSSEHAQRMFRFVLATVLTVDAEWRIFLAAPSQDVAFCVYGLTRVLPEACQRALTFSTYESQPLSCPARLVGTGAADSAETDMPSSCYCVKAVGYNSYTGRMSQVTLQGDFVDHAITAAMTGERQRLDAVLAVCDQCDIDRPELLNLVCRAEHGGELPKEDLCRLVAYPRFMSHLLLKPASRRPLLDHLAEDQELAGLLATRIVPVLKKNREAIATFRETTKQAAIDAIVHGNLVKTRNLLERILPAVDDSQSDSVHTMILGHIGDPRSLAWQVRAYLLTQMAGIPSDSLQSAIRAEWLAPAPAELPSLCGLPIPGQWKLQACLTCLRDAGVTRSLVETLTHHPEWLRAVLRHLPGEKEAAGNVPALVAALLARSPTPAKLVADVVCHRSQFSSEVTSAFVNAYTRRNASAGFRLASRWGPCLLEMLSGADDLDAFLARLLDCPPERLLSDSQTLALLRTAVRKKAPGANRKDLESILVIDSFLGCPTLDDNGLVRLAAALRTFQSDAVTKMVLQATLAAILARDDSPTIGTEMESLFRNLGPFAPGGPGGLYRCLLEQFRSRKKFWKRQHLICAMVAIGLGATESADLPRQALVMAEDARDLVEEVAKRSKKRVFTFIEEQSRSWGDEARLRWNLFAKFVRPRGVLDRVAGPWKKRAAVPMVVLCLIVGASRMSRQGGTVGTGFATRPYINRTQPATRLPRG